MITLRLAALLVLCLTIPLKAAKEALPAPAKDVHELEQRLEKILTTHHVPGMALAISTSQASLVERGLGWADVAARTPATAETLFRIGSVSKTFAGLAALKLVEEGRLDLRTPVRQLVPEVAFTNPWEATDPVRVVHLLEHTTGWDDMHFKEYAHNDPTPATLAQGLAIGPESRTSRWRPGTRYSYCNSGPAVLAAIVEKRTGRRYEEHIAATFFRPIGMDSADYLLSARVQARLTQLYHADGRTPYPYWHVSLRPAGSINASAHDMASCLRFYLNRGQAAGQRLLSPASLRRMETPSSGWDAQAGLSTGYGLHNYTSQDDRGFVWHGHNGGVEGGLTEFWYLPDQGLGYFFSINAGAGEAFSAIRQELRAFITRDLPAPVAPAPIPIPGDIQTRFQGWYRGSSPRNQLAAFLDHLSLVHVSFQGTDMVQRPWLGPSERFSSVDGRRFRTATQSAATRALLETAEGPVVAGPETLVHVPAGVAWLEIGLLYLLLFSLISTPLFALVWGIRWLFRRMRQVPHLHVRVWPLLAELSLLGFLGILALIGPNLIVQLGHRTWAAMGLTAATILFAAFSLAGLVAALRTRRAGMNRLAYLHSLTTSAVFTLLAGFLAWWGIIGLRTWA